MIKKIRKIYRENEKDYTSKLEDMYLYYTTNISNASMAASLKCCVFLLCLYKALEPEKILDLGSGFSSYALRYFNGRFLPDSEIYSVDSSKGWLEKSKQFCQLNTLNDEHFYHWDEIKGKKIPFELIFMDIDFSKNRVNYYNPVCKQFLAEKTFMLADDMHKPILRNVAETLDFKERHPVLDETKHKKRYSWLLEFGR